MLIILYLHREPFSFNKLMYITITSIFTVIMPMCTPHTFFFTYLGAKNILRGGGCQNGGGGFVLKLELALFQLNLAI